MQGKPQINHPFYFEMEQQRTPSSTTCALVTIDVNIWWGHRYKEHCRTTTDSVL